MYFNKLPTVAACSIACGCRPVNTVENSRCCYPLLGCEISMLVVDYRRTEK